MASKPRIAVHKFASCDGCQLWFLNLGETLLELSTLVDIAHFAEAGPVDPAARVDIAFVEGSISMPEDVERIQRVRANSRMLVTLGACATAGGLQSLRNLADGQGWLAAVYAGPGVHGAAAPGFWQDAVDAVASGYSRGDGVGGLCQALARIGELLRQHAAGQDGAGKELPEKCAVLNQLRRKENLKGKCGPCREVNCTGCRSLAFSLTGDYLAEDPHCWYGE